MTTLVYVSATGYSSLMTRTEEPTCRTCRTCREQVVWADDIEAMADGECGDCQEGG